MPVERRWRQWHRHNRCHTYLLSRHGRIALLHGRHRRRRSGACARATRRKRLNGHRAFRHRTYCRSHCKCHQSFHVLLPTTSTFSHMSNRRGSSFWTRGVLALRQLPPAAHDGHVAAVHGAVRDADVLRLVQTREKRLCEPLHFRRRRGIGRKLAPEALLCRSSR